MRGAGPVPVRAAVAPGIRRRGFHAFPRFGFLASTGSDYHGPGESYLDLGDMPPLPAGVTPVWHDW